jgi:hypothetical protein
MARSQQQQKQTLVRSTPLTRQKGFGIKDHHFSLSKQKNRDGHLCFCAPKLEFNLTISQSVPHCYLLTQQA